MKDFLEYPEALALKELGFDEPCFGYYVDGELRGINLGMEELGGIEPYYKRFGFHTLSNHDIDNLNKIVVTAPTYSQAFRWFRENHKLDGFVQIEPLNEKYGYVTYDRKKGNYTESKRKYTLEEAEQACLRKLIELVKGGDK